MPEMVSLLMPHFDYTKPVVKQEMKQESAKRTKIEMKREAKKEQPPPHKATKEEPKGQRTSLSAFVAAKREQQQAAKATKQEPSSGSRQEVPKVLIEQALQAVAPQLHSFDKTKATVLCEAPPGQLPLEAVALAADAKVLRVPCSVDFREDRNGDLKPYAEAHFANLDAKQSYKIKVCLSDDGSCSTHETVLPQRSQPAKW